MIKLRVHNPFVSAPYFYSVLLAGFLIVGFQNCGQGFQPAQFQGASEELGNLASCDLTPHGSQEVRTRYQLGSAPYGSTCVSETQSRICNNGRFESWTGTFTFTSCTVEAPQSCGSTPHNGQEIRTMYQQASAPFGSTCTSETQTRTCSNGQFGSWTGTFTFPACSVAGALSCGSTPHGGIESRMAYQRDAVPYGSTCISQTQTRTCSNGQFGSWTGTYTFTSCAVQPAASCGTVPSGGTETRTAYQNSSVHYEAICVSQNQTRTCTNGLFGAWSGSYQFTSCAPRDFSSIIDVAKLVHMGEFTTPYFIGTDNKLYTADLNSNRAILDTAFSSYSVLDASANRFDRCIVTLDGIIYCTRGGGPSIERYDVPAPARSIKMDFDSSGKMAYLANNELRRLRFPTSQETLGFFPGLKDYFPDISDPYIVNAQNELQYLDFPTYQPVTAIQNVMKATVNHVHNGTGFNIVTLSGTASEFYLTDASVLRVTDTGYGSNNIKTNGSYYIGAASFDFRCTLKTDRTVYCVKDANNAGVAGSQSGLDPGVVDFSGTRERCALLTNGKIKCWSGQKAPAYIEKPLN